MSDSARVQAAARFLRSSLIVGGVGIAALAASSALYVFGPFKDPWGSTLQAIFGGLTFASSTAIALILYKFSKRQTLLQLLLNRWDNNQDRNVVHLQDDAANEEFERIVYGDRFNYDRTRARKRIHLFLFINDVQKIWFAKKMNIITVEEFEEWATPTLRLICREQPEINYLLTSRGYNSDFAQDVMSILNKIKPLEPQDGERVRQLSAQVSDAIELTRVESTPGS